MATLMDASVLIAAERGQLNLRALLAEYGEEQGALAAITASELLHGLHRAVKPEHRIPRESFIEQLLDKYPVIPFDLRAARVHARIWSELARKGITVGAHDLLIAATALAGRFRVATRDQRSFPQIPGLSLLRW